MPEGSPDWTDPAPYEAMASIDRGGLMWEWLRRDPAYVAWQLTASKATTGALPDPAAWGVHFR